MALTRFLRRSRWDDERARELESYLEQETQDNIARGMPLEEARAAARRRLGNATLVREAIYEMNTMKLVESAWQDLRHGLRLLRAGFAIVAILSLSLGIGANTAIFELLDAVRLRTLPVRNPHELVQVRIAQTPHGRSGNFTGRQPMLTNALWERIRDRQRVFSSTLAWGYTSFDLSSGGESRFADGLWVSGGFFDALGLAPLAGRLFTARDDQPGCASPGAVISDAFWRREYGGRASAIGQQIRLDGRPFEIIGVTPPGFFGVEVGRSFDLAVPICSELYVRGEARSALDKPHYWWLAAMGRLKPGVSVAQATAQLDAISGPIFEETVSPVYTATDAKDYLAFRLAAFPAGTGVSNLRRNYETPLWLLLGIAGLVLFIACANLANLMLARATAREREIAVRLAIGASRARIVRQLLAESLLIAAFGAGLGVWIAQALSRYLVSYLGTAEQAVFFDLRADWLVLTFATLVAVAACLLFGLAPAVRATRTPPAVAMRASGRGVTDSRQRFGLRRALVIAQVAVSLVLIVGALLFVRTLRNLALQDLGFRQTGLTVVQADLRQAGIPEAGLMPYRRELLERVRAVPGVQDAAFASNVPISGSTWNERVVVDGVAGALSNVNRVSAGYFRTMGMRLVRGRDFTALDTVGSVPAAVVTESFARKFFHGADAIGRTFQFEAADAPGAINPRYQIVGLVTESKYDDLRDAFGPIVFLAASQEREPGPTVKFIARSSGSLQALADGMKDTMREANPNILLNFQSFDGQIRASLLRERLMATLAGFFGALAALLATIGLYGVMSYAVERRRSEIGIRLALGARGSEIVWMVMREATWLLGAGLALGAGLSLAATRTANTLLFGLSAWDPSTLVAAALGLAAVAALASSLPAMRAASVSPIVALREE